MENENVGKDSAGSGSTDIPISSRVDPTSIMPPFPQGPDVDSMSIEEAKKEWKEMTLEGEKYKTFPRSVFLSRRDALWERGFAEDLENQKRKQEEGSKKWLEVENDRIADRDALEALAEGKRKCEFYFGSEKNAEASIETAKKVLREIASDADYEFLEDSGLGNSPRIIEIMANLKGHPEIYPAIKKIGIKNLIQIGNVALKRRKK